jgi:hypothetical protein
LAASPHVSKIAEGRAPATPGRNRAPWRAWAIQALLYAAIVLSLQYASHAFQDDFSGYNDEPSHYVTALMVRDYAASGFPLHPMAFAENFYIHYPKMAFGHWPPVAYAIFGVWMLVAGAGRTSALLLLTGFTAGCALLLFSAARRVLSPLAAHLIAIAFLLLPIVQMHNEMVMLEIPLTFFTFAAVLALVWYFEKETWAGGISFGVLAGLAIMTKGNAWALALLPILALLLMRDLRRLFAPRLLTGAAIVAVIAGPFTIWSLRMVKDGWDASEPGSSFTLKAFPQLGMFLVTMIGPALAVCCALGIWKMVIVPMRGKRLEAFWAVMLAYMVSVWVFHAVVPTSIEPRKLFIAIPALLLFAGAGIDWMMRVIRVRWAVPAAVALAFAAFTFQVPHDYCPGFVRATDFLLSRPELKNVGFFISSNTDGEGRFIAEVASREVEPQHFIVRSSKALVRSNWLSTQYDLRCTTPAQVHDALNRFPLGIVVVQNEPKRFAHVHHKLLLAMLQQSPDWVKIYSDHPHCTRHTEGEEIAIYQYKPDPYRKIEHVEVDLENKIGRTLRH